MILYFEQELEKSIEEKLFTFANQNEEKQKKYVVSIFFRGCSKMQPTPSIAT